jgi:hypothetical protein
MIYAMAPSIITHNEPASPLQDSFSDVYGRLVLAQAVAQAYSNSVVSNR